MESTDLRWFRRAASATAGVVLVLGLAWIALQASGVLLLVFLSVLLAAGLEPVVDTIRGRLHTGRLVTVLLVYAAFLVALVAIAVVLVPEAMRQGQRIADRLPQLLASLREWASTVRPGGVADLLTSLVDEASAATSSAVITDPNAVVSASLTMAELIGAVATVLTIVILWLTERVRLQRYVLAFLPAPRRAGARDVWNEIEIQLGMWVRGQLILMAAMGITTAIAYTALGLPVPLLLGLVAAVCEAIPIVGPFLGAVPAIILALTVSPETALAVAVVYVAIQIVEGNVLVPLVMRNAIGLPPILVVTSLLVGGAVAGLAGALVAVPIAAAVVVVLERLQARERPVAPDVPATAQSVSTPVPRAG